MVKKRKGNQRVQTHSSKLANLMKNHDSFSTPTFSSVQPVIHLVLHLYRELRRQRLGREGSRRI